jgi:hypothetical protein
MELNKKVGNLILPSLILSLIMFVSCTVSYKFNGAMIDYSKTKTITIKDFPNTAELVYPTLSQEFSESLRDVFTKQTRLQLVKKNGDLQLEGEIVGYQLIPLGMSSDGYTSQTKLTLTVNVRFANNKNPDESFDDKKYTASQNFDSSKRLDDVQDELVKTMIADIVDNIYNDTAGRW